MDDYRRRMYEGFNYPQTKSMSEELKVTKERVLAAADKCSDAKRILQELFPEVFNPKIEVDDLVPGQEWYSTIHKQTYYIICALPETETWIVTGFGKSKFRCWTGGDRNDLVYSTNHLVNMLNEHKCKLISTHA